MFLGRCHALSYLIAKFRIRFAARQQVTGIVSQPTPQHIGHDHIESGITQLAHRPFPIAVECPRTGMIPIRSPLPLAAGLRRQIGSDPVRA